MSASDSPSNDAAAIAGRKTRLSLAERTSVLTMRQAGTSIADICRALNRSKTAIYAILQEGARDIINENLSEYARMHRAGAEIAAAKGDTRPAEWALERTKVVEKDTQSAVPTGFAVKIGVVLPGLGEGARLGIQAGVDDKPIDINDIDE